MATRFAVQHRTTKRYLAMWPALGQGHHETVDVADAASAINDYQAEQHRADIEDFSDAWEVVPVEVEMRADTPSEALIKKRAHERGDDRG